MVLLTSSAISVALSSGVVCIFTFLLFLSGYVLQQQTVRSLQEALQTPLEERVRPLQRVAAQVEEENDTIPIAVVGENSIPSIPDVLIGGPKANTIQVVIADESIPTESKPEEQSPKELWHEHIGFEQPQEEASASAGSVVASSEDLFTSSLRLAYIFSLPTPQMLCSALLFTKWHRQFSKSSRTSIILLYPSDWEMSTKHIEAMELLRKYEEKHQVLLHPVPISKIWSGIDVESQLLSELARNPWNYDRLMYLKSPGMAIDISLLDDKLENSSPKKSWVALRQSSKSRGSSRSYPDIMLWAQGKGLMTPKNELLKLTATASTSHANHHANEIEVEAASHAAAYVIFNEKELEHRKREKVSYKGIFERFERDRDEVCEGTELLK